MARKFLMDIFRKTFKENGKVPKDMNVGKYL
jgi:hypothetical protein